MRDAAAWTGTTRSIAQSASEAIVTADRTGVITYANEAVEAMFGHRVPQIIGRPVTMLLASKTARVSSASIRN